MPALRAEHPGNVPLPVYLGDALQWNLARAGGNGEQPDLLAGDDALEIFVPAIALNGPQPRRLGAATLRFPSAVASDAGLFDRLLNAMIDYGVRSAPASEFAAWLKSGSARHIRRGQPRSRSELQTMRRLQGEGRNHIWGYIARNLARPVWLASDARKAHVVIGNPPWVSFRYMSEEYQRRFREECQAARLWIGGKVATQQDLSAYFFMRAALLYMRREGRIALVLPYAAMSRQAYARFRRGDVARFDRIEFRLRFTAAWAFGPTVSPLFPVPSCVLFAHRRDSEPAPLPATVRNFVGALPRRDADEPEADASLTEAAAPWPTLAARRGGSPYRKRFRNGATLVPRRLVIVDSVPVTGMLPPSPAYPLIRGRTGNQDKAPWKTLEPPDGTVEAAFLRPALLGESIAPFRVLAPRQAVVPWDAERQELMEAADASGRGYPRLARWLRRTEALWERHKGSDLSLLEQHDYYGKLSRQFPIAPIRVVYTKAGTNLAAATVRDEKAVIDHKLYWTAVETPDEACYLCGLLNSEALRAGVEPYQSQGQWGARDFDKYVFNLSFPRFDAGEALHRRLADAARTAAEVANLVPAKEAEHFTRARRRIRAALADHGVAARLESLAAELLRGE